MKILAIDVGTGTQDVVLFDTAGAVENSLKLVMPSPTLIVSRKVRAATAARESVLFEGPMMGGGPSAWALRDHAAAGPALYATPEAARTLDDELDRVTAMGVQLVSEDETRTLDVDVRVRSGDLMLDAIHRALEAFGIASSYDVLATAVFDHGDAPPGVSDRKFRFDYLRTRLALGGGLTAFAHERGRVPAEMTRLRAVEREAPAEVPLVVMDTGPAAVLGALEDPVLHRSDSGSLLVSNIGNFHCLAFHLAAGEVVGLFEHHTGEVTTDLMVEMLRRLGEGALTNDEVFDSMGHGALVLDPSAGPPSLLAVLGPQRNLLRNTQPEPYFATPHGDQMAAGCYGLVRGVAARLPEYTEEIASALDSTAVRQPDW